MKEPEERACFNRISDVLFYMKILSIVALFFIYFAVFGQVLHLYFGGIFFTRMKAMRTPLLILVLILPAGSAECWFWTVPLVLNLLNADTLPTKSTYCLKYNIIQYRTIQHNAIQHNTIPYNAIMQYGRVLGVMHIGRWVGVVSKDFLMVLQYIKALSYRIQSDSTGNESILNEYFGPVAAKLCVPTIRTVAF